MQQQAEKRNLINGYYLLEQDLKEIFSFVEPVPENFSTYSHRLYSLFIRACTEFEANCKATLIGNGIQIPDTSNINFYFKIHDQYKSINDYTVRLHVSHEIDLMPLIDWKENKGPIWYSEYNDVKHARVMEFNKAKLKNVLDAVSAVYILLYARYGNSALCQYQETQMTHDDDDGFIWAEGSLLKIKKPD